MSRSSLVTAISMFALVAGPALAQSDTTEKNAQPQHTSGDKMSMAKGTNADNSADELNAKELASIRQERGSAPMSTAPGNKQ